MNKNFGQIDIGDLIQESVANAALRRQQIAENSLVDVTEEEAKNIEGGAVLKTSPIILGLICPPTTLGIIIIDPVIKSSSIV